MTHGPEARAEASLQQLRTQEACWGVQACSAGEMQLVLYDGMVGMVWYGMVWYGKERYGMVW